MRMCCGCNKRFDRRSLIRLQVSLETQALIPVDKKQTGRSAWVCCSFDCIHKIQSNPKRLQRSLRKQPRVDAFLDLFQGWMRVRVLKMIHTLHCDGVISIVTPKTTSPYCINLNQIPSDLSKVIFLDMMGFKQIPKDKTHALEIQEHHLRQRTILSIDVLKKLKLDSFR